MTEYITLEQAAAAFAIQSVFSTSDCLDALHYAIQKGWISPCPSCGAKMDGGDD